MSSATNAPDQEDIKTETETTIPEQPPEVLTADEVASLLRVSRKTVYAFFKKGEIPGGRRIGAALRFSRTRVLQWLAEGQERALRSPRGAR